ncbi:DUF1501 domain-containing protein [soil metagenome]
MSTDTTPLSGTESEFCCDEFASMSRRSLMRGALVGGVTATFGTTVMTMAASPALAASAPKILVVLSQRGAADGLSLMVPYADPTYYQARPTVAIAQNKLIKTDGTFGLHPNLGALGSMWDAGEMAAVHGTGLAVANRSHFAAMEEVEDAAPGSTTRSGWLNRLLGNLGTDDSLAGFALGTPPASLFGTNPAMTVRSLSAANFGDITNRQAYLDVLWASNKSPIGKAYRTALSNTTRLNAAKAATDNSASYPNSNLGKALAELARVVRSDIGVTLATIDHDNWDMHVNMGSVGGGWMNNQTKTLGDSIAAFFKDLGAFRDRVVLVTISEFGRRVQENSTNGTDHGWGNVMFMFGESVVGGYHAPGGFGALADSLDSDVKVTTDYRDVFADLVTRHLDVSAAGVFPGFIRSNGDAGLGLLT